MSEGALCPNLSQKVQKEVSQMANHNLSCVILLGGLSVNLNHLKMKICQQNIIQTPEKGIIGNIRVLKHIPYSGRFPMICKSISKVTDSISKVMQRHGGPCAHLWAKT